MGPAHKWLRAVVAVTLTTCVLQGTIKVQGQQAETVRPIPAPATPLPPESQSAGITRFSFLVYGDTRSRHDGVYLQPDHLMVAEGMLDAIKRLKDGPDPVRLVLFSGDGVVDGRQVQQWNRSFVDIVARITKDGNVPYFMTAGNHDVTSGTTVDAPARAEGLKNFLGVQSLLTPAEGSPRRLTGYPTYGFGYGNTFFLTLDSNVAGDDTQFDWVKRQLEGLDRRRYANVVLFFHHPVFSSGPHGGTLVEAPTAVLRSRYMPLFNTHHVKAIFAGHEHLFEHWVERYQDATGRHRMDLVVSGGGGAPLYAYQGEPETRTFNLANNATLEHMVRPGPNPGDNPYHFLIVHVDGDRLSIEVVGVDWGSTFRPYRTSAADLQDR
jgi:Calcineurin-like phosphoesterase